MNAFRSVCGGSPAEKSSSNKTHETVANLLCVITKKRWAVKSVHCFSFLRLKLLVRSAVAATAARAVVAKRVMMLLLRFWIGVFHESNYYR